MSGGIRGLSVANGRASVGIRSLSVAIVTLSVAIRCTNVSKLFMNVSVPSTYVPKLSPRCITKAAPLPEAAFFRIQLCFRQMYHGVQDAAVYAFVPDGKLQEFFPCVHIVPGNLKRVAELALKLAVKRCCDAVCLSL